MARKTPVEIRTRDRDAVEVAWFAPLCDDDCELLGVRDPAFASTWEHTADVLLTADRLGYGNILCPSSYLPGQDTWTFASAVAPRTRQISLLTAVRCGELHPPMLARAIATLDHILRGRLTINIISSEMPGETMDSPRRYRRSREVIEILKQAWSEERIRYQGEFYAFDLPAQPVKPFQQNGGPLLYFGGYSPDALDLCARHCDVYLMWPETEERLEAMMADVAGRAAGYGRRLDFGLRVHVIVRETEAEARAWARRLVSRLDDATGAALRDRSLDARSLGVARQAEMRGIADGDGFAEPLLWTGIGRARSGCGAALVGDPDQIVAKLNRYIDMGMRAFILSGYPHKQECELFARHVLPRLKTGRLAAVQGRLPA
uniref:Aliphatic sulfonate monooxygenase family, FMNH2-or F420-dependent n=1 Tax=uncultured Armatimonadetes bacterium TaxID=157466 RepID=A0A6J4JQS7_9BACT|nr:Aliphatic sulfonate monooxygenase family, FMNH2-or F420-dependent [uncultured Armatimonadetes bacterium]